MKRQFSLASVILVFSGLATGCAQGDLPEYNQLGSLRILSLKLDQPEVAPGATVTMTPYLSDLNGGGRILSYSVEACPDPGLSRGVTPSCTGVTGQVTIDSGTIDPSSSATFKSPNYTGFVNSSSISVPSDLLSGLSTIQQMAGVDYIVIYHLSIADGTKIDSLKRIRVSNNTQKNANPTLSSVQSDGNTLTALPSSAVSLNAQFSSGSQETYQVTRTDGSTATLTETLITTWFLSDGKFDYTRTYDTDSNGYIPPDTKPNQHNVLILGVVRDGRGGEDIVKLEL